MSIADEETINICNRIFGAIKKALSFGSIYIVLPPSTSKLAPVIILAESEQRKRAAEAISSGIENRPNGIVERNFALISGVSSPKKRFQQWGFSSNWVDDIYPYSKWCKFNSHSFRCKNHPPF